MVTTLLYHLTGGTTDHKLIVEAAQLIRKGKLVAFPTETVYGLGADALNSDAVAKIFRAKGRPADNPLIVHIANQSQLTTLVSKVPAVAFRLMDLFWPGPLTLIFKKSACVPSLVTASLNTVAVRMPHHPVALALIRDAKTPIAAPSANLSGRPSPTSADHVKEDLFGKIDLILDGGETSIGVESTVLDITKKTPVLLRPGGVTTEDLESVIGPIRVHRSIHGHSSSGSVPSPGMKYTHYAPHAKVILVEGSASAVSQRILHLLCQYSEHSVAVLTTHSSTYPTKNLFSLGVTASDHARLLFKTLRQCDRKNIELILLEGVDDKGLGLAFMNRVRRAASEIIHA